VGEERLFVYGTLRPAALSQAPAHIERAVKTRTSLIGSGHVTGALYWISTYPGLVAGADRIAGDVLALDAALLTELDLYEGDEYARERMRVMLDEGGEIEAWIYVFRSAERVGRRIESGDFLTEAALT
jgi:gamma-glutamylcyclotransferase (GGCT)/AIG2-like uncharacterized protein YtfP